MSVYVTRTEADSDGIPTWTITAARFDTPVRPGSMPAAADVPADVRAAIAAWATGK